MHDLRIRRLVRGCSGIGLASGHSYACDLIPGFKFSGCERIAVLCQSGTVIRLLIAVRGDGDLNLILVCDCQLSIYVCNGVVVFLCSLFQGVRSNLVLTAAHQSLASFYRYAGKSVVSDESSACDLVAVLCQRGAVVFFAVTVRCQLDCHRIDLQCAIDISNLVIACYIRVSVHDLCCGRHVLGRSGVGLTSGHSYAGDLVT